LLIGHASVDGVIQGTESIGYLTTYRQVIVEGVALEAHTYSFKEFIFDTLNSLVVIRAQTDLNIHKIVIHCIS
jgi:hypothetical protein